MFRSRRFSARSRWRPSHGDQGAQNLRAHGVERFIDAILRCVYVPDSHAALFLQDEDRAYRRVCLCGHIGLAHTTLGAAVNEPCPVDAAERERVLHARTHGERAQRRQLRSAS